MRSVPWVVPEVWSLSVVNASSVAAQPSVVSIRRMKSMLSRASRSGPGA